MCMYFYHLFGQTVFIKYIVYRFDTLVSFLNAKRVIRKSGLFLVWPICTYNYLEGEDVFLFFPGIWTWVLFLQTFVWRHQRNIKVLKVTLSPKLDVAEISTLWHFWLPLPIQMFITVTSPPKLSGIGMPSPILWSSHPLKMQRIVLLSSLLWWELGTNSLITGPGEWLSFRRFTSKLSWSWSWYNV